MKTEQVKTRAKLDAENSAALEEFRQAARVFRLIEADYRAKKIGDAEYLAGRKAFIEADKTHDAKEEEYIRAVNALEDSDPTPAIEAIEAAIDYIGEHGDGSAYCKGVMAKLESAYANLKGLNI